MCVGGYRARGQLAGAADGLCSGAGRGGLAHQDGDAHGAQAALGAWGADPCQVGFLGVSRASHHSAAQLLKLSGPVLQQKGGLGFLGFVRTLTTL